MSSLQDIRSACKARGIAARTSQDDDGGGSIDLRFPSGWTEERALQFASDDLDLDVRNVYRGAGRPFTTGGVGTQPNGTVYVAIRWGLDI